MLIVAKNSRSYSNCKKCNSVILAKAELPEEDPNAGLCICCRVKKTDCAIDAKIQKELYISVPWCTDRNQRIINSRSICHSCRHYRGQRKAR